MEDGTVILVGATTENPSFELNSALLSRASVLTFKRLDDEGLEALLARAEAHEKRKLPLTDDARAALIAMADGDGRAVINWPRMCGLPLRRAPRRRSTARRWSRSCSGARRSTTNPRTATTI